MTGPPRLSGPSSSPDARRPSIPLGVCKKKLDIFVKLGLYLVLIRKSKISGWLSAVINVSLKREAGGGRTGDKEFKMVNRIVFIVAVWVGCCGVMVMGPQSSWAQFCRDEVACATVESFGPINTVVLCQYFRAVSDTRRDHVDYAYCQSHGDPPIWECDRSVPRGLPGVSLTQTEWSNGFSRCAKICGVCPSGWKVASQP